MESFRPLAGNGLGKGSSRTNWNWSLEIVSVPLRGMGWESSRHSFGRRERQGVPSPCGEWVGKVLESFGLEQNAVDVSVPLRGMGWERLSLTPITAITMQASFRPLAGNGLGKNGNTVRSTRISFGEVSVPLRGMGWERIKRPHDPLKKSRFPSPCGEWVGKAS